VISGYSGHYSFNNALINLYAPNSIGVYYCGYIDLNNILITHYVGRAMGDGVSIRNRLSAHLSDGWRDVAHFGYVLCSTQEEAESFEAAEIRRLQPKYNTQGKIFPNN